jgi:L-2,4-diaminobutyrate decarboxylase
MCTRRADVLKVWVALERYGARGMAELYDYFCALAQLVYDEISARDDFEALHEPDGNILCFRYVGDGARSDAELDELNRRIRERYNASGEGWITATMLNGRRVLRVTMMNPRTTGTDVRAILDGLATVGRGL